MLLQSLFSPEPNTPHIARYAVLLANSLGAEPILSAEVLGVTHFVQRAGGTLEMLHAISGLVTEAACAHCIQAAADVADGSSGAPTTGAFSAVAADFRDRDATVERLLSAAIVIAGSGSRGIVDHDAAAGIAMLSLAVRVSRFGSLRLTLLRCAVAFTSLPAIALQYIIPEPLFRSDSRRSEAITIAERGCNVVVAALGPQHPSAGNAVDLLAKLRSSIQLRVPDWLLNDSIWRH